MKLILVALFLVAASLYAAEPKVTPKAEVSKAVSAKQPVAAPTQPTAQERDRAWAKYESPAEPEPEEKPAKGETPKKAADGSFWPPDPYGDDPDCANDPIRSGNWPFCDDNCN